MKSDVCLPPPPRRVLPPASALDPEMVKDVLDSDPRHERTRRFLGQTLR